MPDTAALPTSRPTEAAVLVGRAWRLSVRNVDAFVTALVLPVMLMLVFVYLFGGAIDTGGSYLTFVVPGVMLVCIGFGAASTASTVAADLTTGVIDRFRAMGVSGAALVNSHVVASVARNLCSCVLVVLVAVAIGFRSSAGPLRWAAAAGVLAMFVLALSWLCAAVGIVAGSPEAANGMTFLVSFLPYPSSAFVPVDTMPGWLQGFAAHQPVTAVVDAVRALVTGAPVGSSAVTAVLWSVGLTAVAVVLSGALFRRTSD